MDVSCGTCKGRCADQTCESCSTNRVCELCAIKVATDYYISLLICERCASTNHETCATCNEVRPMPMDRCAACARPECGTHINIFGLCPACHGSHRA